MDKARFLARETQGDFSANPPGYELWEKWADAIRKEIAALEKRYAYSASGVPEDKRATVLAMCAQNPESAIHVLINDMSGTGATWTHLCLLESVGEMADAGYPDLSQIRGDYFSQIVQAFKWYQHLCFEPSDVVAIRVDKNIQRCFVPSAHSGWDGSDGKMLEAELSSDGSMQIRFMDCGHGSVITVNDFAAKFIARKLFDAVNMAPESRGPLSFLANRDAWSGLHVVPSSLEDPNRNTFIFQILESENDGHVSIEVEEASALKLAEGMAEMLDITLEASPVPSRSPPRL